jgi:glutamate-ammonia-ligase adenylyltransferase
MMTDPSVPSLPEVVSAILQRTASLEEVSLFETISPISVRRLQNDERIRAFCLSFDWGRFLEGKNELPGLDDWQSEQQSAADWVRTMRHGCFAALTAHEILNKVHPEVVAARWSDCTVAICSQVWEHVLKLHEAPEWFRDTAFVMGFGKLGGGELNLSSDIDIAFFCDPDAYNIAWNEHKNDMYAIVKDYIDVLAKHTGQGIGYRVDLRLRPFGKEGNLIDTLNAAAAYYLTQSAPWERIALLKWSYLCGSKPKSEELIAQIEPFLFRKHLDYIIVEEIQHVRAQIAREAKTRIPGSLDVKLGLGGIREAEFYTQSHQLLFGGRYKSLRSQNHVLATEQLRQLESIDAEECNTLLECYWFLRAIENRAQQLDDQQTHRIKNHDWERINPTLEHLVPAFAKGTPSPQETVRNKVHDYFESLKAHGIEIPEDHSHPVSDALLSESLGKSEKIALLAEHGITAPESMLENFAQLQVGPSEAAYGRKTRQQFEKLQLQLLDKVWETASPERAVEGLRQFIQRVGGRAEVYALLLQNPRLVALLLDLLSVDNRVKEMLLAAPNLLDSQVLAANARPEFSESELRAQVARVLESNESDWQTDLAQWVNEHILRIGIHLQGGAIQRKTAGKQLSYVAESALEQCLRQAYTQIAVKEGLDPDFRQQLDVLALGRFGGFEIGFNSDLDIIAVHHGDPKNLVYSMKAIQRVRSWMHAQTKWGRMFELDFELRPHGGAAALACTAESWERYYQEEAHAWEHLPIARARSLFGMLQPTLDRILLHTPLPKDSNNSLREMRAKIVDERSKTEPLKAGQGGIMDLDLAVSLACRHVILHTGTLPEHRDFGGLCTYLSDQGWWSDRDAKHIQAYYLLVRHVVQNHKQQIKPFFAKLHLDKRQAEMRAILDTLAIANEADFLSWQNRIAGLWERTIEAFETHRYNIEF